MRTTAQVCQSTWDNSRILSKFLYVLRFLLFFFFPSASVSFVPKFQEGERFNDCTQIYIKYTLYLFLRKKNLPFFRRALAG